MKVWAEFKQFISSSNVLGLAVAVVLGGAFGLLIKSFTDDILMQLVAAIGAKPNFGSLAFHINGASIRYGSFLNACINFLIVAAAMFATVKAYNRLARREPKEKKETKTEATEIQLLSEIRDSLRERRPVGP
jgi:large conductance mechanosensitive channel